MRVGVVPRVLRVPRPRGAPVTEPERVVLIGFMGVGKSTIGRAVAERLCWQFRDMDAWIEERCGRTVAQIFQENGEAFFRAEELAVAREVQRLSHYVIAAGGGAFAQKE